MKSFPLQFLSFCFVKDTSELSIKLVGWILVLNTYVDAYSKSGYKLYNKVVWKINYLKKKIK